MFPLVIINHASKFWSLAFGSKFITGNCLFMGSFTSSFDGNTTRARCLHSYLVSLFNFLAPNIISPENISLVGVTGAFLVVIGSISIALSKSN